MVLTETLKGNIMIARPTKTVAYIIGGFEFFDKKDAAFLYNQMVRAARIETPVYVKAIEDHKQRAQDGHAEDFTDFFASRLMGHWQERLEMTHNDYQEVVTIMRELLNG